MLPVLPTRRRRLRARHARRQEDVKKVEDEREGAAAAGIEGTAMDGEVRSKAGWLAVGQAVAVVGVARSCVCV